MNKGQKPITVKYDNDAIRQFMHDSDPTNKPNIEVPNHTDKIDEIVDDLKGILALERNMVNLTFDPYEQAKAQLQNYISEEIKAVIGEDEQDIPEGILNNHWSYPSIRNRVRDEQLATARNRGHNV